MRAPYHVEASKVDLPDAEIGESGVNFSSPNPFPAPHQLPSKMSSTRRIKACILQFPRHLILENVKEWSEIGSVPSDQAFSIILCNSCIVGIGISP